MEHQTQILVVMVGDLALLGRPGAAYATGIAGTR